MPTCQYTGIELENKRQKNHPEVSKLLDAANKRGVYATVVEAMISAKETGLTGLDVVEVGRSAMQSGQLAAQEFRQRLRVERAARDEQRRTEHTRRATEDDILAGTDVMSDIAQSTGPGKPHGDAYSDQIGIDD